uniref:Uncharacterized protein n=1 Tax=Cacopsylla melanoneura TaxID=428564 RepID=A0A8D8Y4Y3_9HEMI
MKLVHFFVLNGIRGPHFKGDGFASEGLDKDLHSSSQSQNQVKGRFLLGVVVRKGTELVTYEPYVSWLRRGEVHVSSWFGLGQRPGGYNTSRPENLEVKSTRKSQSVLKYKI